MDLMGINDTGGKRLGAASPQGPCSRLAFHRSPKGGHCVLSGSRCSDWFQKTLAVVGVEPDVKAEHVCLHHLAHPSFAQQRPLEPPLGGRPWSGCWGHRSADEVLALVELIV